MMRRWMALGAVVAMLGTACAEPALGPSSSGGLATNAEVFDVLWTEFDLQYAHFGTKNVDWNRMRDVYRPRAIAATSEFELAKVLGQMLAELRDRHVTLTPGSAGSTIAYLSQSDTAAAAFDAALIDRQYVKNARQTSGGRVRYGFITPAVGYLRIPSFAGSGWVAEIDAALAELRDAQKLIVDVRGNAGGSHGLAMSAAGRFAASSQTCSYVKIRNGPGHDDFTSLEPQIVRPEGPFQFTKPVVVLTNRRVYSSGENFVLAMRALPNVTTMGDSTAGASGRPITRELPNGWTYTLSTWVEYTEDRKLFENIGLAPDVYVPARVVEIKSGSDPVLARAMEQLGQN